MYQWYYLILSVKFLGFYLFFEMQVEKYSKTAQKLDKKMGFTR